MNNFVLMTITGESAAGKSYLLDKLTEQDVVNKIVSCTSRPPRTSEVEGKDYYFLSEEKFKDEFRWKLDRGHFAEMVNYNGTYYGTTHIELENKINGLKPGAIIVEPQGVNIYKKYCSGQRIQMLKVFVMTNEDVRLQRLNQRLLIELDTDPLDKLKHIIRHTNRIIATATEEKTWSTAHKYDLYVSGEYLEPAISLIKQAIKEIGG